MFIYHRSHFLVTHVLYHHWKRHSGTVLYLSGTETQQPCEAHSLLALFRGLFQLHMCMFVCTPSDVHGIRTYDVVRTHICESGDIKPFRPDMQLLVFLLARHSLIFLSSCILFSDLHLSSFFISLFFSSFFTQLLTSWPFCLYVFTLASFPSVGLHAC